MERVLYRKYRPKKLDEIIGQEHITKTLETALKSGNLAHAYLFTGPRGVGKTSIARILAFEANGVLYDDTNLPLDIIEIDAASNRRIDEIRDLRDKINLVPTQLKYKIYIIDEVHMLTREAFNALLKTLEEPPSHIIFILATTEAYKLPETIVSRTQRFNFKPVEVDKVVSHLQSIAKKENIKVSTDALTLIAEHGEGSFRDSISLLDQLKNQSENITEATVLEALGTAPMVAIDQIIEAVKNSDIVRLITVLDDLYSNGYQPNKISDQILNRLKSLIIVSGDDIAIARILMLMERLLEVQPSVNPGIKLKISLLESIDLEAAKPVIAAATESPKKVEEKIVELPSKELEKKTESPQVKKASGTKNTMNDKLWQDILKTIKKKHNALYGVVRMGVPSYVDNILELQFPFKFHIARINEPKNKQILTETVHELLNDQVTITSSLKPVSLAIEKEDGSDPSVESINNIFGSSEVLES